MYYSDEKESIRVLRSHSFALTLIDTHTAGRNTVDVDTKPVDRRHADVADSDDVLERNVGGLVLA